MVLSVVISPQIAAAEPWTGVPLEAAPTDIARFAADAPLPAGADCEVLFDEGTFRLDAERKLERRIWRIFRVATESAVQDWGVVEAAWAPWHEDRPLVRARVIRADGGVFQLDPKTIAEAPAEQTDDRILSDERMLRAPLPGMAAGAIVEIEIVWRESRPFFAAGVYQSYSLGWSEPTRKTRVVIEAPLEVTVRHLARGVAAAPQESRSDTLQRIVYEAGPHPGLKEFDFYLPPDVPLVPYVAFATGESWSAVATAYADILEPRMAAASIESIVGETVAPGDDRTEAAAKLTRKLNELVRYTGLEFGKAVITPYECQEVLRRRLGDCKDQALLLVSMLRAAGHPANVALLRASAGDRVCPELPGLGVFNHAIVHVVGSPALWIDPTDPYTAAGQLPLADQGKMALIVDRATEELVRTPQSDSAANRQSTTERIEIDSTNGSRINYRMEMTGSRASQFRQTYAENARDELQKSWTAFAQDEFAGTLTSLDFSDPRNLDQSFTITVQCDKSAKAIVGVESLSMSFSPSEIFDDLPWYLHPSPETNASEKQGLQSPPRKERLQLREPHVREIVFHAVPPEGYELRDVPSDVTQQFGPATLTQEFRRDGQAVVATFRFDTGHGKFSPTEVDELRSALVRLASNQDLSQWLVRCHWVHTAYEAFADGDRKRAISLYDELIRRDGNEWVHYDGFTHVLLAAGLGESARRVARQATETFPNSAAAYAKLGFVLTHDLLGRHFRSGMDGEGAAAAYRKSLELDATDATTRWNYAILLEHDADGERCAEGANLDEAQKQYRQLINEGVEAPELIEAFAASLFYTRKFEELRDLLQQRKPSSQSVPSALWAIQDGAAAAKSRLASIADPETRRRSTLAAIGLLENAREYPAAKDLCEQTMSWTGLDERSVNVLATRKRMEDAPLPEDDPRHPVRQLLADVFAHGIKPDRLRAWVANDCWDSPELTNWERALHAARVNDRNDNTRSVAIKDRILMLADYKVAGTPETGYRVTVSNALPFRDQFYVTAKNRGLRVLLQGPSCCELGRQALELLDAGDADAARQWLGWARDQLHYGSLFDIYSGHPFARLWLTTKSDDLQALRTAAAVLLSECRQSDTVIAILEKSLAEGDPNNPNRQTQRALMRACRWTGQWQKGRELTAAALTANPNADEVGWLHFWSLAYLNCLDEAAEFASQWRSRNPKARWAQFACAELTMVRGNAAEGYAAMRKLVDTPGGTPDELNTVAWDGLFASPLPADLLADSRRAVAANPGDSSVLHTQAAVEAELGLLIEAHQSLVQSVDARADDRMVDHDWYVIGRIAEHCGLADDARRAYAKVEAGDGLFTTYRLAQSRLKQLDKGGTIIH
jgi:tetratricopeptide (TPR) repeat protein/transglutaminase-like putative cysteine protease